MKPKFHITDSNMSKTNGYNNTSYDADNATVTGISMKDLEKNGASNGAGAVAKDNDDASSTSSGKSDDKKKDEAPPMVGVTEVVSCCKIYCTLDSFG